jgi:hypothetical protein
MLHRACSMTGNHAAMGKDSDMSKIVYNTCYGGFSLSEKAVALARTLSGSADWDWHDVPRHDAILVQVVEALGEDANGGCAELEIYNLPDGARYRIDEYDGSERVMTPDDYQWTVAT